MVSLHSGIRGAQLSCYPVDLQRCSASEVHLPEGRLRNTNDSRQCDIINCLRRSVPYNDHHNVRGDNATTMAPFLTPSLTFNHLPRRCSCPMPATRSIDWTAPVRGFATTVDSISGWSSSVEVGCVVIHEEVLKNSFGGESIWRELTTPGAGTVPTRVNDLSFESSFHIRISPSQEPGGQDQVKYWEKV